MNPQLAAIFAAHKTAILGGGAAAVAGLALLQRRKKTAGAAAPGATQVAGTVPAAAVVATPSLSGAGYNSSSSDLYQALQPELEAIRQTQGTGINSAPAPVASTLFAPTGTGTYARYGNGTVSEVESDGSQLGLTQQQWNQLLAKGAAISQVLPAAAPAAQTAYYETAGNLANVTKPVKMS